MRAIVLGLAVSAVVLPSLADAKPIKAGVVYRGKLKLTAVEEGVSFVLPKGWQGGYPAEGGDYFVMRSADGQAMMYAGIRNLTVARAKAIMSSPIPVNAGIVLTPSGAPRVAGRRLSGVYSVNSGAEVLPGYIETVIGKDGRGVFVVAVGRAPGLAKTAKRLVSSVSIRKPKPAATASAPKPRGAADKKWVRDLRSKKITRFFTGSGYTEKESLWLCANGRFYRQFNSGGFTPGGSSAALESKYRGAWTVSGGSLSLRYDDASTGSYALSYGRKGLELDGRRWFREATSCK